MICKCGDGTTKFKSVLRGGVFRFDGKTWMRIEDVYAESCQPCANAVFCNVINLETAKLDFVDNETYVRKVNGYFVEEEKVLFA